MPTAAHYYLQFEEGKFYHVYNRTVDKKPMFRNDDNYRFFLSRFDQYLSPVIDVYAYSLLGNHFHFLVRVQDLTTFRKLSNLPDTKGTHEIVTHQFRKFFQSYAMAFNKQHERVGTLFQTPFKRALIDNNSYLKNVTSYIHRNPQLHHLVDDFKKWPWTSYSSLLSERATKLRRNEVVTWFGGTNSFEKEHTAGLGHYDATVVIEDDM